MLLLFQLCRGMQEVNIGRQHLRHSKPPMSACSTSIVPNNNRTLPLSMTRLTIHPTESALPACDRNRAETANNWAM